MVITKEKAIKFLVIVYLIILPFGQLLRTTQYIGDLRVGILLVDIVALATLLFLRKGVKNTPINNQLFSFLASLVFSLIISFAFIGNLALFGFLYLARLAIYTFFFLSVSQLFAKIPKLKESIFKILIIATTTVSIFGIIQYLMIPDTRILKVLGWDDHYYRLVGTFFDPAYVGILIVFGTVFLYAYYLKNKKLFLVELLALSVIALVMTYSRASYLAFFAGMTVMLIKGKNIKHFLLICLFFVLILNILPERGGEGVNLARTFSITDRMENYKETIQIWKNSPVFGIGYNNICVARKMILPDSINCENGTLYCRHNSCSGADSSILFILATSGIVGLMIFINLIIKVLRSLKENIYGISFLACTIALFTHSMFSNSIFYPFVLGIMAISLALAL